MPAAKKQTAAKEEFVQVSTRVDSKNMVRKIEKLTPAHCRECGFSVLKGADWDELDTEARADVRLALKRHITKLHGGIVRDLAIVDKDSLPTKWYQKPLPV